jgi:hypothetical protein
LRGDCKPCRRIVEALEGWGGDIEPDGRGPGASIIDLKQLDRAFVKSLHDSDITHNNSGGDIRVVGSGDGLQRLEVVYRLALTAEKHCMIVLRAY